MYKVNCIKYSGEEKDVFTVLYSDRKEDATELSKKLNGSDDLSFGTFFEVSSLF